MIYHGMTGVGETYKCGVWLRVGAFDVDATSEVGVKHRSGLNGTEGLLVGDD